MAQGSFLAVVLAAIVAPPVDSSSPKPIAELHTWDATGKAIDAMSFSANSHWLAIGDVRGRLKVWDLRTARLLCDLDGYEGQKAPITSLFLNQKHLFAGSRDALRVWDVPAGCLVKKLDIKVDAMGSSPDGKSLMIVGGDVQYIDVPTMTINKRVAARFASWVAVSPDCRIVIESRPDPTGFPITRSRAWGILDGKLRDLDCSDDLLDAIAFGFSADAQLCVVGFDSDAETVADVEVWDNQQWKMLRNHIVCSNGRVRRIAFVPKTQVICCNVEAWKPGENGLDKPTFEIRFVDVQKGLLPAILPMTGGVGCFAVSPDGRYLATSGKKIRIWDLSKQSWRSPPKR